MTTPSRGQVFGGPNARVRKTRTRSGTSGNEPVVRRLTVRSGAPPPPCSSDRNVNPM
jgi:hypothetical protein